MDPDNGAYAKTNENLPHLLPSQSKPSTICPSDPNSDVMTDAFRTFILNTVNKHRSDMAKGLHPSMNGTKKFPAGKNINKLSWSCEIEAAGYEMSQTCAYKAYPNFGL